MRTGAAGLTHAAGACSRDGQAIADGLIMLFNWTVAVVAGVLLVAVVSGLLVGHRRGAAWRQAGRHALWGMAMLVVGTTLALLVMAVKDSLDRENYARQDAAYQAWLAPLAAPAPGALDVALRQVEAGPIHNPLYLAGELPARLAPLDGPLLPREVAALEDLARHLRREVTANWPDAGSATLDRLDGAVAWRIAKPAVPPALAPCGARYDCLSEVLAAAERWCRSHAEPCRDAQSSDAVATLVMRFKDDAGLAWSVQALQGALYPGKH